MPRDGKRRSGFTLIELLTVIAIISILAAITMSVGPRVLEKAKIATVEGDLKQMSVALAAYFVDFDTFPPAAYDVLRGKDLDSNPSSDGETPSNVSYLQRLNLGSKKDTAFYDKASSKPRKPFVYIPVYAKNVDFIRNELGLGNQVATTQLLARGRNPYEALYREVFDLKGNLRLPSEVVSEDMPPVRFDLWVLLSTGTADPEQDYGGLNPAYQFEKETGIDLRNTGLQLTRAQLGQAALHRLTAYLLATLDKDNNGYLDYDFRTRSKNLGPRLQNGQLEINLLPNGSNGYGPLIALGP